MRRLLLLLFSIAIYSSGTDSKNNSLSQTDVIIDESSAPIDDLQIASALPPNEQDWVMTVGNESAVDAVLAMSLMYGGRLASIGYYVDTDTNRLYYYAIMHRYVGPVFLKPPPMNYSELVRASRDNELRSLALTRVCGQEDQPGIVTYATYWERIPDVQFRLWFPGSTAADTQRKYFEENGYRLNWLCGYSVQNRAQYVGVWQKPTPQSSMAPYEVHYGLTLDECLRKDRQLSIQGFVPILFRLFDNDRRVLCVAIWEQRPGHVHRIEFDHNVAEMHRRILQTDDNARLLPRQISHFIDTADDNRRKFAVLWSDVNSYRYPDAPELWPLNGTIPSRYLRGSIAAFPPARRRFLVRRIERFMRESNIPGLSIALVRNESLIFAAGFGYANVRARQCVTPNHQFRVGSVSKPITAVAILVLVDRGKIRLDQHVFGPDAILGTEYGHGVYSPNVQLITVRNLLEHTSGGWDNFANDAAWTQPHLDADHLIDYVLENYPIENVPGTQWIYSNFGYLLLGKIIERVSGVPYEQFVKDAVWSAVGVHETQLATQRISEKAPREVLYYMSGHKNGFNPYDILPKERIGPWGGWTASPIELLRFLVRADGFANKTDIISRHSIELMSTASLASNDTYGLGWSLNIMGFNGWQHDGRMPGAAAMIIRLDNGIEMVVNKEYSDRDFFHEIAYILHHFIEYIDTWPPTIDLF